MADRKPQKFCHIMGWVKAHDPELADAISDLCMGGQLSSRFGGATLLYPPAKIRKEIVDGAYSAEPEAAIDLIRAHIIPMCLKSAADFTGQTIGSKLEIEIGVESATAATVKLTGGAQLKPAKDFKPLRNDKIAVWLVDSGTIPTEGKAFEYRRRKGGGAASTPDAPAGWQGRQKLAAQCEAEFKSNMSQQALAARVDLPYLKRVTSLMQYLAAHPECHGDLVKAVSTIDRNPVSTFYILVEPYKADGEPFLSHRSISGWISSGTDAEVAAPATEMLALFEQLGHVGESTAATDGEVVSAGLFSNPSRVFSESRAVAQPLCDGVSLNLLNNIAKAYSQAIESNRIGTADAVWPAGVAASLGGSRKLWQDMLRFDLRVVQSHMHNRMASTSPGELLDIFETLVQQRYCGSDYWADLNNMYGVSPGEHRRVAPTVEVSRLCEFVMSWDFLYCPRKQAFVKSAPDVNIDEQPQERGAWPGDKVSHAGLEVHAKVEAAAAAAKSTVSFAAGPVPGRKPASTNAAAPTDAAAAFGTV
jgi:hypothetical protein